MKLTIKLTISLGKDQPQGSDHEAQIGTYHESGTPDLYLGFTNGMEVNKGART